MGKHGPIMVPKTTGAYPWYKHGMPMNGQNPPDWPSRNALQRNLHGSPEEAVERYSTGARAQVVKRGRGRQQIALPWSIAHTSFPSIVYKQTPSREHSLLVLIYIILNRKRSSTSQPLSSLQLVMSPNMSTISLKDHVVPRFTGLRTADDLTSVAYVNGDRELYDNRKDPRQLRNRYSTASAPLEQRLAAWLAALEGASGEALRQAELNPPK